MSELRETDELREAVSRSRDETNGAPASPPVTIDGDWEQWYAWYPVTLYMSGRYAWLRPIYRRCIHKNGVETCDYTDAPDDFPAGS
jgi:hypothetical protein